MEDKKYTAGPWITGGCSGRMITTPTGYVGDGFIADVDTEANAQLISAAPESLEALQKTNQLLKILYLGGDTNTPLVKERIDQNNLVINKSLGITNLK